MTKVMSAKQKEVSQKYTSSKLKTLMASTALAAASMVLMSADPAHALPSGENVISAPGSVTYDRPDAVTLNANQTTPEAYTLWDTFDTATGETVNINMPNGALSVNKVIGDANGTQFDGFLNATNGNVWILDQNGVFFGATAQIDVGGLLASTGDVSLADVMDGGDFTLTNFGNGTIENLGEITVGETAGEAGLAAFVGPDAVNRGIINARIGKVAFAAGETVTVDLYGDGLFEIAVSGELAQAGVRNSATGEINAEGGVVQMTTRAASALINNVVNLDGVVNAGSFESQDGKIVLHGGRNGRVAIAGEVETDRLNATGDELFVRDDADVNVSKRATLKADTMDIQGDITANRVAILRRTDGIVTLGSEVASTLSLTQAELDKLHTDELTVGNDDAAKAHATDINVGNVDFTDFASVALNALAASSVSFNDVVSVSFNDVVSFGNLAVNSDNIFVNAALSATGVNFNALNGGAGTIVINDVLSTAGGEASFTTDSFTIGNTGGISTLGGDVNVSTDNAAINGLGINAANGTVSFFRVTDGGIGLGSEGAGLNLSQNELNKITADKFVAGNADSGSSNTTNIVVTNANLAHFDEVELNALANSNVDFNGSNFFASLAVAINVINVGNSALVSAPHNVNADSIHFSAPTVNLNGDLNAPSITGTATTIAVQSNAAEIQDGVDVALAGAGAVVSVDDGTYTESVVIAKDGVTVQSVNGAATTTVQATGLAGIPFSITGTGVTVDGFTAVGGLAGFDLSGSTDATVQNNVIHSQALYGVYGLGFGGANVLDNMVDGNGVATDGMTFINATDLTVAGNTIQEVRINGINVTGTSDNVTIGGAAEADGNTIFGEGDDIGVNVNGGSNITVGYNTIDDTETAVSIKNATGTNSVSDNTATSVEYGVVADTVSGLTIARNSLFGNSVVGIDVVDSAGVDIDGNDLHDFVTGISLKDSGGNAKVRNNLIKNDTTTNLATGIIADNTANAWIRNNDVEGAKTVGIHVKNTDGTNDVDDIDVWHNRVTVTGDATGILVEDSDFATVGAHNTNSPSPDGLGIGNVITGGKDGIVVKDSAGAIVRYNTVYGVSNLGVNVDSSNGSTIKDNDIDSTGSHAILLGASDDAFVQGNDIDGAGKGGIRVDGGDNVTINMANNINTVGTAGVALHGTTNATVDGNFVYNTDGSAIWANEADGLTVSNNTISETGLNAANLTKQGVHVQNTVGVTIDTNTIDNTNNGGDGVEVTDSTGVIVTGNYIGTNGGAGNIDGEGIDVNNGPSSQITDNEVSNTVSNGISINPSPNSIISGNTVSNFGADAVGIYVKESDGTKVLNNTVSNDGTGTAVLVENSSSVQVGDDDVWEKVFYGRWPWQYNWVLTEVNANTINNTENGIVVTGGTLNTVANNTATGVDYGIKLDGTTYATVRDNDLTGNSVTGIDVAAGSNFANVYGNSVDHFDTGINVSASSDVTLDDNTLTDVLDGVVADTANNLTVTNNDITGRNASGTGVKVTNSENVKIGDYSIGGPILGTTWVNDEGNDIADFATGISADSVNGLQIVLNDIDGNDTGTGVDVTNSSNVNVGAAAPGSFLGFPLTHTLGNDIDDFETGVNVDSTDTFTVTRNDIDSVDYGVDVEGGTAGNVTNNDINGNSILGISVSGHDGINVIGNTLNHFNVGIQINDSENAIVKDNTLSNIDEDGIRIYSGSHGSTVEGNDINDAGVGNFYYQGIVVADSNNVTVFDNDVSSAETGIAGFNSFGLAIDDNDIWNVNHGIYVNGGGDAVGGGFNGVTIINNDIDGRTGGGKGTYGIRVENSRNAQIGSEDNGNTVEDFATGIRVVGSTTADIEYNHVHEFTDHGVHVSGSNWADIKHNEVHNGSGNGIYNQNSDDAQVNNNEVYDVDGNGILVNPSDDVEVAYNRIHDTGIDGIKVEGGKRVYIHNNHVGRAGDEGIDVEGNEDARIHENHVHDSENTGIEVSDSRNADIRNNYVEYAGNDGINVVRSAFADIRNNEVRYSDQDGIEVDESYRVDINDNHVHGTEDGNGIKLSDSRDAEIRGNRVHYTGDDGIDVENSRDVQVTGNNIHHTDDDGIDVEDSRGATIAGNTIENTDGDGIEVKRSSFVNVLRNIISRTGDDGIDVEDSYRADINENRVHRTEGNGIEVEDSWGADVKRNHVGRTDDNGIYVKDSNYADVEDNYVHDTGENGIYINSSDNVDVVDNEIEDTGDHGIKVNPSDYVDIINNRIHRTGWDGINVEDGVFADIKGNHIGYTRGDGIDVTNNFGVDINFNRVHDTGDNGIEVNRSAFADIIGNDIEDTDDDGIEVHNSRFVDVLWNKIRRAGDDGIDVEDSFAADVNYNNVAFVRRNGIEVQGSDFADIKGNWVSFAGQNGIYVNPSDYVDIENNFVFFNRWNGIQVNGGYDVDIIGNITGYNGHDGIQVNDNSGQVIISGNTSFGNDDDGIDVDGAPHVEIRNNLVYDNGFGFFNFDGNGIEVSNVYDRRTLIVDGNTVRDNANDGIDVHNVNTAYITNNTIYDNGDDGVDIEGASHVEISQNTIYNNGFGPFWIAGWNGNGIEASNIYGRDTLIVSDNIIRDNANDGVHINDVNHAEILSNTISGNGDDGVDADRISSPTTLIISGNTISDNDDTGIEFSQSPSTFILNNQILDNGNYGVFGKGAYNGNIELSGNVFTNNPVGARFESGIIDLTGDGNVFNFGDVALQFAPAEIGGIKYLRTAALTTGPLFAHMELVDDTIGSQFFNGQSTFFVELDNGAFFNPGTPTVLDATDSTFVTPFGTVRPSATGGFIGADTFAFLESRFFHFVDDGTLGLFFFGEILSPEIDQEDIFRDFGDFGPFPGGVQFTLNGLPFVDPAIALANIAPAAGDDENSGSTAEELAGIEPAAGGSSSEEATCWGDAVASAGNGVSVNFSFGSGLNDTLAGEAGCQSTDG